MGAQWSPSERLSWRNAFTRCRTLCVYAEIAVAVAAWKAALEHRARVVRHRLEAARRRGYIETNSKDSWR